MIERFHKCDCGTVLDRYEVLKKGLDNKDSRIRLECSACKRGTYVSVSAARRMVEEIEKRQNSKKGMDNGF